MHASDAREPLRSAPGLIADAESANTATAGRVLGTALVLSCLAYILQSVLWETNGDTSWLITVIDRLHGGDRLFVDVIELNPPSSVWLYLPPVQLSYVSGLPAEALVRAYTLLICLGAVAVTGWLIRAGNLMSDRATLPAMALLFVAATVLVGNSFAERDHIGAVLLTPLITIAAWRSTKAPARPGPAHWIAAGVAGGVIAIVKPYYAIVVVAAAACVVVKRRDVRLFLLPEFVIAGLMSVAYMVAFYLAYPVYFETLLPLLRQTYMAFRWPASDLALVAAPWLAIAAAYLAFGKRGGANVLTDLLMICALAAWLPYFIQGKGWAYHAYPAAYLGSAAIIVAVGNLLFASPGAEARGVSPIAVVAVALLSVLIAHSRFIENTSPWRTLAASVRAQVNSPTVALLGGDIASGHPLARMIGGRWIEPYCSDWIPTFALRLKMEAQSRGDSGRAAYFEEIADRYLGAKRERLMRALPDVLIVDEDDQLVAIMLAEHGFAQLLKDYVKIGADRDLAVYRLIKPAGAAPPRLTMAAPLLDAMRP